MMIWAQNIESEISHWRNWLTDPKMEESRKRRISSTEKLSSRTLELIGKPLGSKIRILDVGSGPISTIGRSAPGYDVELVCTDALADHYNKLLKDSNLMHLPSIFPVKGEDLESNFGRNAFDLVNCANALDHFEDPALAFVNMYNVCAEGGVITVLSIENEGEREGYRGLHQWNLRANDDGLWLSTKLRTENIINRIPRTAIYSWKYVDHGQKNFNIFLISIKKASN
ncbi:class I SAM-dependent methyltransferase [Blastochloris tepida]|uniref:Methyltransferase type 11 domain-containing protein n=1 Tax=Blastochloris tepida TaxID=2233851 RepID=A0A348G2K8_9HYPH|nr:methyltransferase domain-containing protein [Blastochloris tepida]BBF93791.1 hypothetical protein BLTE_24760 [Blastochloris tepida]